MRAIILIFILAGCAGSEPKPFEVVGHKIGDGLFLVCGGGACAYCKRKTLTDAEAFQSCREDLGI